MEGSRGIQLKCREVERYLVFGPGLTSWSLLYNLGWHTHWGLKSTKSGFARVIVSLKCLKNLDVLSPRIDAKK